MNIIFPMGGLGTRFQRNGYRQPKPLINIVGKPMILWLIDNLHLGPDDTMFFGVRNFIEDEFQLSELVKKELTIGPSGSGSSLGLGEEMSAPKIKVTKLYFDTRGASETLYIIVQSMTEEEKLRKTLSLDCDTIYFSNIIEQFRGLRANESACFYFEDTQEKPVFSYIELDENDSIINIKEKHKISTHANTGAYGFASAKLLEEYCGKVLDQGVGATGEYYTSNVISKMLSQGLVFKGIFVEDFACVGTPWQLEEFLRMIRAKKVKVKPRRFCFDLDNTLVKMPAVPGDYSTCEPIWKNIKLVQQLKDAGHHIIIYTARRMKTHRGNVGAILADVGLITFEQLKKYEIPCDEIHFGKPYANVYIDDLAVHALIDTEKELGWIQDEVNDGLTYETTKLNIISPRSCNTIQVIDDVVIKSSTSDRFLGEIYFYQNLPQDIMHLFPKFICSEKTDVSGQLSLHIERVRGVSCSHLLTSRCLTEGRFVHILSSLKCIHESEGTEEECGQVDIYSNYANKLRNRWVQNREVYLKLAPSDRLEYLFRSIHEYLEKYHSLDRAIKSKVIHGDPVFSNIILENDGNCRFIDMRGLQGSTTTLQGDVIYDLSKVYQSLWGYDFVLIDRYPLDRQDVEMLARMRDIFRDYVLKNYSISKFRDIEMICASLLFSLIPLHDELHHQQVFLKMCESIVFPFGIEYL